MAFLQELADLTLAPKSEAEIDELMVAAAPAPSSSLLLASRAGAGAGAAAVMSASISASDLGSSFRSASSCRKAILLLVVQRQRRWRS